MLPNIKSPTDSRIKKKKTMVSILDLLKINKAGAVNKEIQIKLKE